MKIESRTESGRLEISYTVQEGGLGPSAFMAALDELMDKEYPKADFEIIPGKRDPGRMLVQVRK